MRIIPCIPGNWRWNFRVVIASFYQRIDSLEITLNELAETVTISYEFWFILTVSSQSACPEMSAYANEEMRSLEEEVACLDKVLLKVEVEMRHAMGMNGQFCPSKSTPTTSYSRRSNFRDEYGFPVNF